MKAMGIDIGTTTISGVILDVEKKQVVETRTIPNGSFLSTGKDWERMQDVSVILKKARALVDELLDCCPDCASIGLTGQISVLSDQLFEGNGIEARSFTRGKYLLVGAGVQQEDSMEVATLFNGTRVDSALRGTFTCHL